MNKQRPRLSYNAYKKVQKLDEWNIPYEVKHQGIIINDKIMIAKNSSKWKFLGELDWYPYYGLSKLVEALYDDALELYAQEQQSKTHRNVKSVPISHEWKDKHEEEEKRGYYRARQQKFGVSGHRDKQ